MAGAQNTTAVSTEGRWLRWLLALTAIAALLRLVFIFVRYDAYAISKYYMADDTFYYCLTARHLAQGLGSTFDGVHATNGYHPLWFLVATAVFRVIPGLHAPLLVLYLLQAVLLFGSALLVYRALSEIDRPAAALTTCLLLASRAVQGTLFNGMESGLCFFLASWLLLLALRWRRGFFVPSRGRDAALIFVLLAALSLARLECGLLAGLWLVVGASMARGRQERLRVAMVAFGLAAVAVTYLGINLRVFGVPLPVSGLIKASGRPSPTWILNVFSRHRDAFVALIGLPGNSASGSPIRIVPQLILLVSLVALMLDLRRRDPERFTGLAVFLAFAAGYVTVAAVATSGAHSWYMWPAILAGVLAMFGLIRWALASTARRFVPAILAVLIAFSSALTWYATARTRTLSDWGPMPGIAMDATVRYLREEIPAGDRVGGISSGIFTYFSERPIENLEGLANGVEFFQARRTPETYGEYLRRNRIRWVVFYSVTEDGRDRQVEEFRQACGVEQVVDLDSFYRLGLKRVTPLPEPNVYVLRLRT